MAQTPLQIATTMLGKSEGPDHAALTEYLKNGGVNLDPATTAWCAAFVNSTLKQSGLQGTGSNLAKSFTNYGTDATANPQTGDIAVFNRGDPNSMYGHVGFIQSYDPKTHMAQLMAGNQGNAVSVHPYDLSTAVAVRHPGAAIASPQDAADAAGAPRPAPAAPLQGPAAPNPETAPAPMQGPQTPPGWTPPKQESWRDKLSKLSSGFEMPAMAKDDTQLSGMAIPKAARVDAPDVPMFDQNQIASQRQQLAVAMQRLNSGRLF